MSGPFFFGYGSLVNRRTHDYPQCAPARVRGWRRAWRASPLRRRCFLTAVPAADGEIEGLVAMVPGGDWAALDAREHAYARRPVLALTADGAPREVALYAIPEGAHHPPGPDHPVVLSYIDAVVQGFLAEFGAAGARRFFDSTEGWQVTVIDDRAAPIYARHQRLGAEERAFVDAELARLGVRIVPG
ncbi:MAG: gamma-glutamylcyclotransferase [Alphaproteobacteria bacterium]|nr:MAG: gamma-glutamylcyclotransferase [Alphaproteobacteria bacterium]